MKKTAKKKTASKVNPLVVVRTVYAGVHIGELVAHSGQSATLRNARRLWRWRGANTLHEVSLRGVSDDYTRLSEPVASIDLTTVIERLPVSAAARDSLTRSRWAQ